MGNLKFSHDISSNYPLYVNPQSSTAVNEHGRKFHFQYRFICICIQALFICVCAVAGECVGNVWLFSLSLVILYCQHCIRHDGCLFIWTIVYGTRIDSWQTFLWLALGLGSNTLKHKYFEELKYKIQIQILS